MKALELVGEVDEQQQLHARLPADAMPGTVRVLVLWPESNGLRISETNGAVSSEASDQIDSQAEQTQAPTDKDWDAMMQLIQNCQVDTGIEDLAYQHDHYLYGKPKKPE